jgi:hypothetical protein
MAPGKLKKFDWMAGAFFPLAVILMETFWVAPYLKWIGSWTLFTPQRPILSLGSVFLVLAVSLALTRLTANLKQNLAVIRLIVIGGAILTLLVVTGYEYPDGYTIWSGAWFSHIVNILGNTFGHPGTVLAALIAVIYLWWRGIVLGQSTTFFRDIYRTFILGMVALVILIILWNVTSSTEAITKPGAGLGLNVIAFFFFGLIAIAIAHLYQMRSTMPKEEAALTSVWRWFPVMLGVIGGVVLIGFILASALSPDFFNTVGNGASAFLDFLGTIFKYLLYPFVYAAEGIVWLFWRFMSLFKTDNPPPSENLSGGIDDLMGNKVITHEISPVWSIVVKWVLVAIVAVVIIFILSRAISRIRSRRNREEIEEERVSIFSWKALRDDLKEFFKGVKFPTRKPASPPFDLNETGKMDIRNIYRHLQVEASISGITRHRHETAGEYAFRLERAVPNSVEAIGDVKHSVKYITDRYEEVRYGDAALPEPQVDQANTIWQVIKGMIRKLRGESPD